MIQSSEQSVAMEPRHDLEAHQLLLIGIVGTTATLIAFIFCTFIQALSFGLLSGVFTYSLILTYLEREDHSTWNSVNHWSEGEQHTTPAEGVFQADSETVQAQ